MPDTNIDIQQITIRMEESAAAIRAVVAGITEEQACWKPDAETWSVREVMGHLWDEERLDFRVRIDYSLHRPGETWPPIDPAGWVRERRYNERDLADSLAGFLEARAESL
ncbi:MAG: DinB family protein, partial [Anaerolineae bacterium]